MGSGLDSVTHRNLQLGCLDSWCSWICSYGHRSLSLVAVGSQFVSETRLGNGEARILLSSSSVFQDGVVSEPMLAALRVSTVVGRLC